MAGCKYFVWGGGRWREVDTESGHITGWRRASFVFVRGRRLVVARRRRVLRALRALAAGLPSDAADGPRLSYYRKSPPPSPKALPAPPPPAVLPAPLAWGSFLCAHTNSCNKELYHARCDVGTHYDAQNDKTRHDTQNDKTRHDASVQYDEQDTLNHVDNNKKQAKQTKPTETEETSSEEEAICELTISDSDVNALRGFIAKSRPEALERFNVDIAYRRALFYAINPTVSLRRCPRLEKALLDRDEGALPHFAARLGLSPAPSSVSTVAKAKRSRRIKQIVAYTEPSSDSDTDKENDNSSRRRRRSTRTNTNNHEHAPSTRFTQIHNQNHRHDRVEPTPTDKHVQEPARTTRATGIGLQRDNKQVGPNRVQQTKDVESNRLKIERMGPNRVGSKQSEAEKEGSDRGKPEKIGSERSKPSVTEKVKTKNLGSEKVITDRAKLKRLGDEQEGAKQVGPKRAKTEQTGSNRSKNEVLGSNRAKQAILVSDESDEEVFKPKTPLAPHSISKPSIIAGTKEYSNLEDHAIVSWVSSGHRATLVNGNKLWQELQEQYIRLTGIYRSWHSLRNRYLRYILPSLGALGLPPDHTARLRAGAATGVAKSRVNKRRASIISKDAPLRGAASRAPRPPPPLTPHTDLPPQQEDSGDDTESRSPRRSLRSAQLAQSARAARSPRYSEVTRRFAAKHPPRSSTSTPTQSPTKTPTSPTKPHTRKLFNPNYKV